MRFKHITKLIDGPMCLQVQQCPHAFGAIPCSVPSILVIQPTDIKIFPSQRIIDQITDLVRTALRYPIQTNLNAPQRNKRIQKILISGRIAPNAVYPKAIAHNVAFTSNIIFFPKRESILITILIAVCPFLFTTFLLWLFFFYF